ncbi:MAG: PQQ-binding-like beta-propeller repeat protein, partial [Vicinamibacterales bacterium]
MTRTEWRVAAAIAVVGVGLASTPYLRGQNRASGPPSTANGEWTHYTADVRGSKYSPLAQITAANFNKLEVAWRFKTDNLGPRPEYKLEGTPLMIGGVLYTTAGTRRSVIALDAKTGELMWSYSFREGKRASNAPRQLSGRGVSYWTDGKGDDRVIYVTPGYRMIALNAHTGAPIPTFGTNGIVDLKVGVVFGNRQPIDLETGEIGLHATPTVAKDVILVGSSFKEGTQVATHNNTKGIARAFDVRTGKVLWSFNTIPRPGEFGNETWENDSWAVNGNAGVWTQITVDEEAGLVYLPVEDPTSDQYGGHRPGNNLFADTLVCVDLKTGIRKWHFQVAHHPIWDYDLSSAPLLADINVNGRAIKAVALPSKESFLYVFDRITGQPVWPIEERPVPQTDVPGEKTSPTQPFPTKPPAYARQAVTVDELINFTPEMRAEALEKVKMYRMGPMFLPPVVSKVGGPLQSITIGTLGGGTNWPGASYDPELHTVFAQAANAGVSLLGLVEPPPGFSDIRYVAGIAGQPFRVNEGPGFGSGADAPELSETQKKLNAILAKQGLPPAPVGRGAAAPAAVTGTPAAAAPPPPPGLNVQGLTVVKPPYGVLSAINLDRGDLVWQVPHGDTPDQVRNHPALRGLNIPKTGQQGSVGLMVTKTLVILGDPAVTTTPEHPRGAMLRAYDKTNGNQVGAVWMPAPQSGSPMTYSVDGKQYIIVAVSGGAYSGEYIS